MTTAVRTPIEQWTQKQALILSAICLTAGVAGGWSIRAWQGTGASQTAVESAPTVVAAPAPAQAPSPAQLKAMADTQAETLMSKLNSDANNPDLLTGVGNIYYDAQQYAVAVDYYGRALKTKPDAASVRTDMATAYWYMGDADRAIAEYNKVLTTAPNDSNALFNRGLVKWRGKKDAAGALEDFKKLMAVDPNYAGKDQVGQMTAEAKGMAAAKAGTGAK
ncbi:MAG: tetratricopeptide repeat protein [Terracidiphilus sp.]|jgi:tetratricopeptide (TPR) repeat protein